MAVLAARPVQCRHYSGRRGPWRSRRRFVSPLRGAAKPRAVVTSTKSQPETDWDQPRCAREPIFSRGALVYQLPTPYIASHALQCCIPTRTSLLVGVLPCALGLAPEPRRIATRPSSSSPRPTGPGSSAVGCSTVLAPLASHQPGLSLSSSSSSSLSPSSSPLHRPPPRSICRPIPWTAASPTGDACMRQRRRGQTRNRHSNCLAGCRPPTLPQIDRYPPCRRSGGASLNFTQGDLVSGCRCKIQCHRLSLLLVLPPIYRARRPRRRGRQHRHRQSSPYSPLKASYPRITMPQPRCSRQ